MITWLAWRSFFARRRQRFLPLLTLTAIGGVAIGVMALVVVLSVMRGFSADLTDRLLRFNAHIEIVPPVDVDVSPDEFLPISEREKLGIKQISRFVEGEAIAQGAALIEEAVQGVRVRGMENAADGVVLGDEAALNLLVSPAFDDEVMLTAPLAEVGPTGDLIPRTRRFRVVDLFHSGIYEYDSKFALVSLADAESLLGQQARRGFRITLHDPHRVQEASAKIKTLLGDAWSIFGWHEQNRKLFAALKLERMVMTVVLCLVVLIASFSIVGVILLITASKRRDVAILKSLGMPLVVIRKLFLLQGCWIGAIGSVIGALVGVIICKLLQRWPIELPSSYYLETLPVALNLFWILGYVAVGMVIAMLASFYPVLKTSTEDPCEVLRYE